MPISIVRSFSGPALQSFEVHSYQRPSENPCNEIVVSDGDSIIDSDVEDSDNESALVDSHRLPPPDEDELRRLNELRAQSRLLISRFDDRTMEQMESEFSGNDNARHRLVTDMQRVLALTEIDDQTLSVKRAVMHFICAQNANSKSAFFDSRTWKLALTDLKGLNLSGLDMSLADLSGADLSGANLSQTNLFGANLRGAKLVQTNLSQTNLCWADLSHSNLTDACLDTCLIRTILNDVTLDGVNLSVVDWMYAECCVFSKDGEIYRSDQQGAETDRNYEEEDLDRPLTTFSNNWTKTDWAGVTTSFRWTDVYGGDIEKNFPERLALNERVLKRADFEGEDLAPYNFSGLMLIGANFAGVNGPRSVFAGADLQWARFGVELERIPSICGDTRAEIAEWILAHPDTRISNLQSSDFQWARLYGADFSATDVRAADFRCADLWMAKFKGADLRGADFRGADVRQASFVGADLRFVDFSGMDLSGVNFSGADLRGAKFSQAIVKNTNFSGADMSDVVFDLSNFKAAYAAIKRFFSNARFSDGVFERIQGLEHNVIAVPDRNPVNRVEEVPRFIPVDVPAPNPAEQHIAVTVSSALIPEQPRSRPQPQQPRPRTLSLWSRLTQVPLLIGRFFRLIYMGMFNLF